MPVLTIGEFRFRLVKISIPVSDLRLITSYFNLKVNSTWKCNCFPNLCHRAHMVNLLLPYFLCRKITDLKWVEMYLGFKVIREKNSQFPHPGDHCLLSSVLRMAVPLIRGEVTLSFNEDWAMPWFDLHPGFRAWSAVRAVHIRVVIINCIPKQLPWHCLWGCISSKNSSPILLITMKSLISSSSLRLVQQHKAESSRKILN